MKGTAKLVKHFIFAAAMSFACCTSDHEVKADTPQFMENKTMYITIEGKTMTVQLEDNSATRELLELLQQASITYTARDYGGFEKVGELGHSLPTSNEQITTQAGDVILYSGSQIVLFYGSNSWSYTRLGRIQYESIAELKSFLKAGQGNVSVTLSLGEPSAIAMVSAKESGDPRVMTIDGIRTESPRKGVYIQEGKKYLK
jgi:hypothetical protein